MYASPDNDANALPPMGDDAIAVNGIWWIKRGQISSQSIGKINHFQRIFSQRQGMRM